MRILYVINGFDPGGAEHGLLTLIRTGIFDNHDLRVIGFCRGRGSPAGALEAELGSRLRISDPGPILTARVCVKGIATLAGELRTFKPDLIVLSLKQANVIGRVVLSVFPRIWCVSFEHIARYRARRAEAVYQYLLWILSFRVDEIWADCSETLKETDRYFIRRKRITHVMPLFRADEAIAPKTDYQRHTPLRIAAAGRLTERKNFDVLIEAIGLLNSGGEAATLDLYGEGPIESELRDNIALRGLGASVRLNGYVEQWYGQLQDYDIFVNLSDTEGFCIVVAEAMSIGLPVVATDVGGVRDYGRDQANLEKLNDIAAVTVAQKIRDLAADELCRRRLGETARADMLRSYSESAVRTRGREILSVPRVRQTSFLGKWRVQRTAR